MQVLQASSAVIAWPPMETIMHRLFWIVGMMMVAGCAVENVDTEPTADGGADTPLDGGYCNPDVFEDDELASYSRLQLGRFFEPRQQNISSLGGMECAVDVTYFDASDNKIQDLTPLSELLGWTL